MTRQEMVHQAASDVGSASCSELAEFIRQTHGVEIEPAVIALIQGANWRQDVQFECRRGAKAS